MNSSNLKNRKSWIIFTLLAVILFVLSENVRGGDISEAIPTNTYLSGSDISGKSFDEAKLILINFQNKLNTPVKIVLNKQILKINLQDLGASIDVSLTMKTLQSEVDRTNSFSNKIAKWFGYNEPNLLAPTVEINRQQMDESIIKLFPDIKPAQNAKVSINTLSRVIVQNDNPGIQVDFDDTENQIRTSLLALQIPEISLKYEVLVPEISTKTANEVAAKLRSLLSKSITFTQSDPEGDVFSKTLRIPTSWIEIGEKDFSLNTDSVSNWLHENLASGINIDPRQDATITAVPEITPGYATVEGDVIDGKLLLLPENAKSIIENINTEGRNEFSVELQVSRSPGKLLNKTGTDLEKPVLLGRGRSDFSTSPWGRISNIKKGIGEKMNHILINSNEEFSFNSFIGSISNENGWKDGLVILNGTDLSPEAGGGLCQVSTTIYRAVLYAGLPITKQTNHSIYVGYYRKFGDGLDATIYPGSKDFKFKNDTGHPIILLTRIKGTQAIVDIYGTPDGRKIELSGPYYNKTVLPTGDFAQPKWNQILWIRSITDMTGQKTQEKLLSTYLTAPY